VFQALFEDQNGRGVALGELNLIGQISSIEIGGMPTPEEIDQIAGRKQQPPSIPRGSAVLAGIKPAFHFR
jgi:hypothetical protein